nr:hypothetical protein [Tanacetum cinerariifolium]
SSGVMLCIEAVDQKFEAFFRECFSKDIHQLIIGLNKLISFSLRNCALPNVLRLVSWQPAWSSSAKAMVLLELIGEFVALMFGEVLGEGASLSMEVEKDAPIVSDGSRVATEIGILYAFLDGEYSIKIPMSAFGCFDPLPLVELILPVKGIYIRLIVLSMACSESLLFILALSEMA